jgi:hypothetical protein
MEIENKTLEILDLVREKVLSPDEALPHILRLFSVVGRSEQLATHQCKFYVNADWTKLKCECGKEQLPSG